VASRKRKKRSWLKMLLVFICVPLVIWAGAFLVWFYWYELTGSGASDNSRARVGSTPKRADQPVPVKRPQEKILEEDRKKLEDILKRQS
jgi:flagellar basal body-associated protein FliL